MRSYLLRRFALSLITLWLVTVVAFVLLRVAPGDAVLAAMAQAPGEGTLTAGQIEAQRAALGLDRSYPVQYVTWTADLLRLDPGASMATGAPVWDETAPRLAVTIQLALLTIVIIVLVGCVLGVTAARYRGSRIDTAVRSIALAGLSTPAFWLGLLVVVAVAAWTGRFIAGAYSPLWDDPWRNLQHVGPAALVLAVRPAAVLTRVVRTSTAEALGSEYARAARARGLSESRLAWMHAFRSAMLPAVTVMGAQVVFLLGGAVLIEQVFGLPGIGRALVSAVMSRDYTMVQFLVLVFAVVAVVVNLVIDLLYARLDPRVRLS
ncbi:MAG: ABC transporter permease [Dehalococcoidia bacterium]